MAKRTTPYKSGWFVVRAWRVLRVRKRVGDRGVEERIMVWVRAGNKGGIVLCRRARGGTKMALVMNL